MQRERSQRLHLFSAALNELSEHLNLSSKQIRRTQATYFLAARVCARFFVPKNSFAFNNVPHERRTHDEMWIGRNRQRAHEILKIIHSRAAVAHGIPLTFAHCVNKQAIERKTHEHSWPAAPRMEFISSHRIHWRSMHGCRERTNSLRGVSIDSSICGATKMPRPRHATTSAQFYYVYYFAMWCLSVFVGAALASNFISAWVCQMGMRIAANWNRRSVSVCLEPATPPAQVRPSVTHSANSIRFWWCALLFDSIFAFMNSIDETNRTWWNPNKMPNCSICMYSLNDYCFCAVSFDFVDDPLRLCVCAALAIVCYLLMLHIVEWCSIQQQMKQFRFPIFRYHL